jgi:hypothetical protein
MYNIFRVASRNCTHMSTLISLWIAKWTRWCATWLVSKVIKKLRSANLKMWECSLKLTDRSLKFTECSLNPTECSLKLNKCSLKLTENSLKLTEYSLKSTECSVKWTECSPKVDWMFPNVDWMFPKVDWMINGEGVMPCTTPGSRCVTGGGPYKMSREWFSTSPWHSVRLPEVTQRLPGVVQGSIPSPLDNIFQFPVPSMFSSAESRCVPWTDQETVPSW